LLADVDSHHIAPEGEKYTEENVPKPKMDKIHVKQEEALVAGIKYPPRANPPFYYAWSDNTISGIDISV
jgi:hypothetical protein